MKARRIAIIVISVLSCIILVSVAAFRIITSGREYVDADGFRKNTRFYIENVYYTEGVCYYTIINKTYQSHRISYDPCVEYWKDDQWVCLTQIVHEVAMNIDPFADTTWSVAVDELWEIKNEPLQAGEYRIVDGDVRLTNNGKDKYNENSVYLVAYFTVTEDML